MFRRLWEDVWWLFLIIVEDELFVLSVLRSYVFLGKE